MGFFFFFQIRFCLKFVQRNSSPIESTRTENDSGIISAIQTDFEANPQVKFILENTSLLNIILNRIICREKVHLVYLICRSMKRIDH